MHYKIYTLKLYVLWQFQLYSLKCKGCGQPQFISKQQSIHVLHAGIFFQRPFQVQPIDPKRLETLYIRKRSICFENGLKVLKMAF